MATERQLQETIARCVSTMVHYHDGERSSRTHERMVAEAQVLAGFVLELGFSKAAMDLRILRPVESELIARYGHELGPRMVAEFVDAFDSLGQGHQATRTHA